MAVDMYLILDGIAGEAQDSVHAGQIDVLAWSWGASQSGTTHMGSGGGSGKASFQDLSVTKYVDISSPALLKHLSIGKHIATGKLIVRKAGETPLEYMIYELTDLLITSISTGGSGGEDRLTENISINFAAFSYKYTKQGVGGGADTDDTWAYDIAGNVEA
jgi:type VI secretion system secreted protein Hcp